MKHSDFIYLLKEELLADHDPAKKLIIRFHRKEHYKLCLSVLKQMQPEHSHSIQAVRSINGLVCSLRSIDCLERFEGLMSVEENRKLRVCAMPTIRSIRDRSRPERLLVEKSVPWGVKLINAPKVWSYSAGGKVRIGVIDTGVDYTHPDLQTNLARGVNLVNRSALAHDDNGHGTHIAGTIAAANYPYGILGVAPRAVIYPIKAFDHNGAAYVSDIILGIDWCIRNRINIINMSFGMREKSPSLYDAVRNAYQSGIVIVASSGNDGRRTSIDYPARFKETISVGAITKAGSVAPFTNRGRRIDIYAPGEKIASTWLGGKYNVLSGTSMATSHVSGVIALIVSLNPLLRPAQLKTIVRRSAIPLSKIATPKPPAKGQGVIDALRAYKFLKRNL